MDGWKTGIPIVLPLTVLPMSLILPSYCSFFDDLHTSSSFLAQAVIKFNYFFNGLSIACRELFCHFHSFCYFFL